MIDTHCHLTDERLLHQVDDVLARALSAGVTRVISIGTDLEDSRDTIAIARNRSSVRCAVGVHPNYTQNIRLEDLAVLRDLQSDPAVVAIGEIGLDYHHGFADRDHQKALFKAQLDLARELDRPVILHSREAVGDTLAILRQFPTIRAVFHSFTGSLVEAMEIVEAGYCVGFTGPVTYKKNDDLREAVMRVPLDRLLIETDAPYLSPEPMRKQKINEPASMIHTAARIAQLKKIDVGELDRITTENAHRLFGRL